MSPKASLELRSLMMIAMLAVAEGIRVRKTMHPHDAFKSRSASSSHGADKRDDFRTSDVPLSPLEAPFELLLEDPAVHEQLDAMTGHLETFALELDMLLQDPAVRKQLEVMRGHLKSFLLVFDMVRKDPAVHKQLEAMTGHLETFALESDMLLKDPAVHKQLEAITGHLETFALEVDMLRKTPAVHKQLEAMNLHLEMFPDQMKLKTLFKDMNLDELADAVKNPSPELEEVSAEVRSAIDTTPLSLVQVNQSSEQESSKLPTRTTLAALKMLARPGLAHNIFRGAKVGAHTRPDGLAAAAGRGPHFWRTSWRIRPLADTPLGLSKNLEDSVGRGGTNASLGSPTSGEAPVGPFLPADLPTQMRTLPLVDPTQSGEAATEWTARINKFSTYASLLCAIDCTVLPLLLILMPVAGGSDMLHQAAHLTSLYIVLPIGGTALTANFIQHRKPLIALRGLHGLALILLANGHLQDGLLSPTFAHMVHEHNELFNLLGCVDLLSSQWASEEALKDMGKACKDSSCGLDHGKGARDGQGLRDGARDGIHALADAARASLLVSLSWPHFF